MILRPIMEANQDHVISKYAEGSFILHAKYA